MFECLIEPSIPITHVGSLDDTIGAIVAKVRRCEYRLNALQIPIKMTVKPIAPPHKYPNRVTFGSVTQPAKEIESIAINAKADSPRGPSMRAEPVCTPNSPNDRVHHVKTWLTHP
jgi:hypothetical protein